jgi:adenine deaminase
MDGVPLRRRLPAEVALPVIPELKLTDQGLVDLIRFEPVSLFAGG